MFHAIFFSFLHKKPCPKYLLPTFRKAAFCCLLAGVAHKKMWLSIRLLKTIQKIFITEGLRLNIQLKCWMQIWISTHQVINKCIVYYLSPNPWKNLDAFSSFNCEYHHKNSRYKFCFVQVQFFARPEKKLKFIDFRQIGSHERV